jgi:hypothetical protein
MLRARCEYAEQGTERTSVRRNRNSIFILEPGS